MKSNGFRAYEKCVSTKAKNWIDNLNCAADLMVCLKRTIDDAKARNPAGLATLAPFAGSAAWRTELFPEFPIPNATAVSTLFPSSEAEVFEEAIRILNAINKELNSATLPHSPAS